MFRTFEAVTNAAREGARVGVLPGYDARRCADARQPNILTASGLTGPRTINVANVPLATRRRDIHRPIGGGRPTRISSSCSVRSASAFGGTFGTIPLRAAAVMRTEAQPHRKGEVMKKQHRTLIVVVVAVITASVASFGMYRAIQRHGRARGRSGAHAGRGGRADDHDGHASPRKPSPGRGLAVPQSRCRAPSPIRRSSSTAA